MIDELCDIARQAGKAILEIAGRSFDIKTKEDHSPVTEADLAANDIINQKLIQLFPNIPIFSEENENAPFEERAKWKQFFLLDPIDGTKNFIAGRRSYTVNIALVKNQRAVSGVVFAPAMDKLYFAEKGKGAFLKEGEKTRKLHVLNTPPSTLRVVASKHHLFPKTEKYINNLKQNFSDIEVVQMGSSLKLCLIAEGKADLYPRLGPTSEWDTAAAQIVVEEAGGFVYQFGTNDPLVYNKPSIENPHFIVGRPGIKLI